MELEQLLDFLARWMKAEHACLAPSLARFLGTDRLGFEVNGAGPESLAGDFSRFRFLLGATDGEASSPRTRATRRRPRSREA